ncbi:MAG: amino acid ABC transporter permease [Eubacteriales bacterium]|nr:amino acid ABC transporter permease [Eubacteriales bacterium]
MSFASVNALLLQGFGVTCLLFLLTLVFSLPLGLVVMFGSICRFRPLRIVTRAFVWIIRGTPLMLQLFVVFYVPGMLFHVRLFGGDNGRFLAALVAFVINYACYFSEIYRGGLESIPRGQYEAAQVLGMTRRETFFRVILMQLVKRILAPMSNEVITLVKDTSLARVIIVAEIFYVNETFILSKSIVWPLFYIGVFFLVFVGALTLLFRFLEKKLSYYNI